MELQKGKSIINHIALFVHMELGMYHPGTGGRCLGALITYQSSCKRPHAHSTNDCSYNSSVLKRFLFQTDEL